MAYVFCLAIASILSASSVCSTETNSQMCQESDRGACFTALQKETQIESGQDVKCKQYLEDLLNKCSLTNTGINGEDCESTHKCHKDLCRRIWDPEKCSSKTETTRFVYSRKRNACITLEFLGCLGGNENSFETEEECEAVCKKDGGK